jgi:hypothetical protein
MNTRHRHSTENGGKNGTEDQMHVDFHVLHPNQNSIHQRAESDHPSKDGRQAKAHIGHPRPAEFNSVRTLPQSFRVNDLFRFVTRLEAQQGFSNRTRTLCCSSPPRSCSGRIRAGHPATDRGSVAGRR